MSRVYFHTEHETAELRGSERAWLSSLCNRVTIGLLDLHSTWNVDRLKLLINPSHYMNTMRMDPQQWTQNFETALSVGSICGDTPLLQWKGHPIDTWNLVLNTALRIGNDSLKLAARIHAQCEIHCWVDGPDRAWLAGIMEAGLSCGLFRGGDQGWEGVVKLLRSRDDGPVVLSYSVCEQFPGSHIGRWEPTGTDWRPEDWDEMTEDEQDEAQQEAWYDLPDSEKWRISMEGLRKQEQGLQIKPDDWSDFHFGRNLSALDLLASDWEERLGKVFLPEPVPA